MNQNLSLYRIFYTVALCGTISRAADELFISQPAVSKSIHRLEQSVGAPLFLRSSRGVQLTEDGELLFSHVKTAFQTLENAENQLKLRQRFGKEQLRIGVSSTLCKYVLLPVLSDFICQHPHLHVTISCQSAGHTLKMMESGDLDLGLTGKPSQLHSLQFTPVMEIQDTFAASSVYLDSLKPLLGKKSSSPLLASDFPALLKNGVLMLLDQENMTRQYLDRHLKEEALFPEHLLEITSMDLLIDFARVGLGVAGVIREFVRRDLEDGSLLEIPFPFRMLPREIGVVWRQNEACPPLLDELTAALK